MDLVEIVNVFLCARFALQRKKRVTALKRAARPCLEERAQRATAAFKRELRKGASPGDPEGFKREPRKRAHPVVSPRIPIPQTKVLKKEGWGLGGRGKETL